MQNNTNNLFDERGRRIPYEDMRVFNEVSLSYYKINQPEIEFEKILSNSKQFADIDSSITVKSFESVCMELKKRAQDEPLLKNLFNGIQIPFICRVYKYITINFFFNIMVSIFYNNMFNLL